MRLAGSIVVAAMLTTFTMASIMASLAHEEATGVIKQRMEAMESMARAVKAINQRIKANRDLDAIQANARLIQELARQMPSLFPAGSAQLPSEAKAAIWERWSDFESKAASLVAASTALGAADTREGKALTAHARAVSNACGSCHELYRTKRQH